MDLPGSYHILPVLWISKALPILPLARARPASRGHGGRLHRKMMEAQNPIEKSHEIPLRIALEISIFRWKKTGKSPNGLALSLPQPTAAAPQSFGPAVVTLSGNEGYPNGSSNGEMMINHQIWIDLGLPWGSYV